MVRMDARRLRILKRTFSVAVTRPAAAPATMAMAAREPGIVASENENAGYGSTQRK